MSSATPSSSRPSILEGYRDLLNSSLETLLSTEKDPNKRDVSEELLELYQSYMLRLVEDLTGEPQSPEINHPSELTDADSLDEIARSKTDDPPSQAESPFSILSKTKGRLDRLCRRIAEHPPEDWSDLCERISNLKSGFLDSRLADTLLSLQEDSNLSGKDYIQKHYPDFYETLKKFQTSNSYSEEDLEATCANIAKELKLLDSMGRSKKIIILTAYYLRHSRTKLLLNSAGKKKTDVACLTKRAKAPSPPSFNPVSENEDFVRNRVPSLYQKLKQLESLGICQKDELTQQYTDIAHALKSLGNTCNSTLIETLISDCDRTIERLAKKSINTCSSELYQTIENLEALGAYKNDELAQKLLEIATILNSVDGAEKDKHIQDLIEEHCNKIRELEQPQEAISQSMSDEEFVANYHPVLKEKLDILKALGAYENDDLGPEYSEIATTLKGCDEAGKAQYIEGLIEELDGRIKLLAQQDGNTYDLLSDKEAVKKYSTELYNQLERAHDLEGFNEEDRAYEYKNTRNDIEKPSIEDRETVIYEMLLDLEERIMMLQDGSDS